MRMDTKLEARWVIIYAGSVAVTNGAAVAPGAGA
jgi:hypothetical protein